MRLSPKLLHGNNWGEIFFYDSQLRNWPAAKLGIMNWVNQGSFSKRKFCYWQAEFVIIASIYGRAGEEANEDTV